MASPFAMTASTWSMKFLDVWAQAGVGAVGVAAPEPATTALGAGAVAIGADNIWTGAKKLWSGTPEETTKRELLEAAVRGLGADDQTAERLADGAELGLDLAGPAGAAKSAGYGVKFWRYPNAGGFGVGVTRRGKRKFAADVHEFTHDGVKRTRPHLHYGSTGNQRRKHRPWEGGWKWR